jgi:hypothetical protein
MHVVKVIEKITGVKPPEGPLGCWSFANFYWLSSGYSIIRPIRDEMGILNGVAKLAGYGQMPDQNIRLIKTINQL